MVLFLAVLCDVVDRTGNLLDVAVAHGLIDRKHDTVFENRLSDGAGDLLVIHRRETEIADGPGAREEVVILEYLIAVNRHRDVTSAG